MKHIRILLTTLAFLLIFSAAEAQVSAAKVEAAPKKATETVMPKQASVPSLDRLVAAPEDSGFKACCVNCSSVVCSTCNSSLTGVCTGTAKLANCSMINDIVKCVPAPSTGDLP